MAVIWNICGMRVSQRRHACLAIPLLGLIFCAFVITMGVPGSIDDEVSTGEFVERTTNSIGEPIIRKHFEKSKKAKKNAQSSIEVDTTVQKYAGKHGDTEVEGHTTYRLRLHLPSEARNVYAMFGDARNTPHVPAAWFSPLAMKHTAPPSKKLYEMEGFEQVALSSFLSLGPEEDDGDFNQGSVGAAIRGWTDQIPVTLGENPGPTDDFSLFWMDPDEPAEYPEGPLIAQLTVPTGKSWYVKLGLQGRMHDGPDWQLPSVVWVHDEGGANCPPGTSEAECLETIGTEF